jgi:hypothetical protein
MANAGERVKNPDGPRRRHPAIEGTLSTVEHMLPSTWCRVTKIWQSLPDMNAALTSPWLTLTIAWPILSGVDVTLRRSGEVPWGMFSAQRETQV